MLVLGLAPSPIEKVKEAIVERVGNRKRIKQNTNIERKSGQKRPGSEQAQIAPLDWFVVNIRKVGLSLDIISKFFFRCALLSIRLDMWVYLQGFIEVSASWYTAEIVGVAFSVHPAVIFDGVSGWYFVVGAVFTSKDRADICAVFLTPVFGVWWGHIPYSPLYPPPSSYPPSLLWCFPWCLAVTRA